jgi:hypothetical protein
MKRKITPAVTIEIIPAKSHRYKTVGDWTWDKNGNLKIHVSDMGNKYYALLVAMHEMHEAILCKLRDISEKSVCKWDIKIEANRLPEDNEEPGDKPGCPYLKEHFFATNMERLFAAELGVDWKQYEEAVLKSCDQ